MSSESPRVTFQDRLSQATNEDISSLQEYLSRMRSAIVPLRSAAQLLTADRTREMSQQRAEILKEVEKISGGELNVLSGILIQFSESDVSLLHDSTSFSLQDGDVKGFYVYMRKFKEGLSVVFLDYGKSKINYENADIDKKKLYARAIWAAVPYDSLAFVTDSIDKNEYKVEDYFALS